MNTCMHACSMANMHTCLLHDGTELNCNCGCWLTREKQKCSRTLSQLCGSAVHASTLPHRMRRCELTNTVVTAAFPGPIIYADIPPANGVMDQDTCECMKQGCHQNYARIALLCYSDTTAFKPSDSKCIHYAQPLYPQGDLIEATPHLQAHHYSYASARFSFAACAGG